MNAERSEYINKTYADTISLVPVGTIYDEEDLDKNPNALKRMLKNFMGDVQPGDIRPLAEQLLVKLLAQVINCNQQELDVSQNTYQVYAGFVVWHVAVVTDGYTDGTRKQWTQEFWNWLSEVAVLANFDPENLLEHIKQVADVIQNVGETSTTSFELIDTCLRNAYRCQL